MNFPRIALLAFAVAACSSRETENIAIAYGTDVCAYCRMTIDDESLAAAFEEERGHTHPFGEPGCLAAWLKEHTDARGVAWVRDASGEGWLRADDAFFARGLRTPMAYGLAAFRDRDAALVATRPAGAEPLTWAAVLTSELRTHAPTP
jgi:copper chaperone NosL